MEHLCDRRYSSAVRPKMLFPSKRPIAREYVRTRISRIAKVFMKQNKSERWTKFI